jgi:DNA transformation protein
MDRDYLIDLFAPFGPVTIKRMFSGFGVSVDGVNFAIALRSGLYFRADEETIARFEAEGSKPFQYQTRARTVTVNSYWELPARLFDDPDELPEWARAALSAAQRAAVRKRPKAPKSGKAPTARAAPRKVASEKVVKKDASKRPGQAAATRTFRAKTSAGKTPASKTSAGSTSAAKTRKTRTPANTTRAAKRGKA